MSDKKKSEETMLSGCEALIMKVVWDAEEDLSVPELMEQLRVRFNKDYKRTTIATFLTRLAEKGFAESYRKGYLSYVRALKTEEEYKNRLIHEEADLWFGGSAPELMMTLTRTQKLSKADIEKIRSILDELDD